MKPACTASASPCVVEGVEPFFSEIQLPLGLQVLEAGHPQRCRPEQFVQQLYRRHYAADIQSFYATLLSFSTGADLQAVVGFRDGRERPLFSEQYLDAPVEQLIAEHWAAPAERGRIVEVGNLALASPGQARWVIAAVTEFLYAAGYRWVLFTVVTPLVNAFRRLGLNPIRLAAADPARLPDGGRQWGSYYAAHPCVCVGDIEAGHHKLRGSGAARQPLLQALLDQAARQGAGPQRLQRLGGGQ